MKHILILTILILTASCSKISKSTESNEINDSIVIDSTISIKDTIKVDSISK